MTTWLDDNRANWDERVDVHLAGPGYDLTALRAGRGRLYPVEEAELGAVAGLRVLHLQCHFGHDTLTLAQRGAEVVGLDFSPRAIAAARRLATELQLAGCSRFVEANVYDAVDAVGRDERFDLVFVTWGAISWLPDITGWAAVVAHFLKPGGALYMAEGHPVAWVLDDAAAGPDGRPGWFAPYGDPAGIVMDDPTDYANPQARLRNSRQHSWNHGLGQVVTALIAQGLQLEWLHEHVAVPWQMFRMLVRGPDGLYRWPDRAWFPLAFSLRARRPA